MADDLELAQMFAELATSLEAQESVTDALAQTVQLALQAVDSAEMAGVSWLVRGHTIETPFCTDPLVARADTIQDEFEEGPGIDASVEGVTSVIDDTATDPRWPRFSAAVAELGIASVLSCQLSSPRRTLGSLNLYARPIGAFDDGAREIAQIYAAHSSIVLASRTLETDLRTAVDTRGTIGQAIGILIERHRVTPKQGFDLLVKASQNRHVKLRDLAEDVVRTGVDPSES